MKKNKVLVLLAIIFLLTGCGANKYLKDEKGTIIINETTGQSLRTDILCRPSRGTETYELYEKYNDQLQVKLENLPECRKFTPGSNKTKSLWQFIFVKPLAFLILRLGNLLKSFGLIKSYLGLSVIIIGLLIRLIILPFNIKTQKQSKKLQEIQPEIQRIERKYAGRDDQESLMAKSQETMMLYKKYKVNPLLSCLLAFIQLPLFFAFLEAINKIPTIYEGQIFGWNLGTTPKVGVLVNHQYSFIILVLLIIATTYFSFKYTMGQNTLQTNDANKQMNTMAIFMTIFIGFASISLPTAIALYWITTYAFIIIQTYLSNVKQNRKANKEREIHQKKNKIKDKLKVKEGMKYGKNN